MLSAQVSWQHAARAASARGSLERRIVQTDVVDARRHRGFGSGLRMPHGTAQQPTSGVPATQGWRASPLSQIAHPYAAFEVGPIMCLSTVLLELRRASCGHRIGRCGR